jgi:hypothetical protein
VRLAKVVGTGILQIDGAYANLYRYEEKNGKAPLAVSRHEIPIMEIEETLKWQGTTLKQGDILMIRSGYVRWHNEANETERKSGTRDNSVAIGVQANENTVRWFYDKHLSALVGDTVAFEAWPPKFTDGWCLHEWILVHWGMPIGEMWDLEKLSEKCKSMKRYSKCGSARLCATNDTDQDVHSLLPHECAIACQGRNWKSAWRDRDLLGSILAVFALRHNAPSATSTSRSIVLLVPLRSILQLLHYCIVRSFVTDL